MLLLPPSLDNLSMLRSNRSTPLDAVKRRAARRMCTAAWSGIFLAHLYAVIAYRVHGCTGRQNVVTPLIGVLLLCRDLL